MMYPHPLKQGTLIRRYKRFLADINTTSGTLTIHCPNTGSMRNCWQPGWKVWYWDSGNSQRKYPCTWELVENDQQQRICTNTGRSNKLVEEAIKHDLIIELQGYDSCKAEVAYGKENSRIDFLLSSEQQNCYVEVKQVTLLEQGTLGYFPDSVSLRASRHLRELTEMVKQGHRAVLCFCVAHEGIESVSPADHIDADYGHNLRQAINAGVEVIAYKVVFLDKQLYLSHPLELII